MTGEQLTVEQVEFTAVGTLSAADVRRAERVLTRAEAAMRASLDGLLAGSPALMPALERLNQDIPEAAFTLDLTLDGVNEEQVATDLGFRAARALLRHAEEIVRSAPAVEDEPDSAPGDARKRRSGRQGAAPEELAGVAEQQAAQAQASAEAAARAIPAATIEKRKATGQREVIYFGKNKDVPLPGQIEKLAALVKALGGSSHTIRLAGHASTEGSGAYNMGLSQRRLAFVENYLVTGDIRQYRIESQPFGEERPAVPEDGADRKERESKRALNRRVEIDVFFMTNQEWLGRTRSRLSASEKVVQESLRRAQERVARLLRLEKDAKSYGIQPGKIIPQRLYEERKTIIGYRLELDLIRKGLKEIADAAGDPAKTKAFLLKQRSHLDGALADAKAQRAMHEVYRKSALDTAGRASAKEKPFWQEVAKLHGERLNELDKEIAFLQRDKAEAQQQGAQER